MVWCVWCGGGRHPGHDVSVKYGLDHGVRDTPEAGDSYGQRVRGYLVPPTSGSYNSWVAGDDNVQLWLSSDVNPANKRIAAHHSGYTNVREWNRYPTQRSAPVMLAAGTRYYVEALHTLGRLAP